MTGQARAIAWHDDKKVRIESRVGLKLWVKLQYRGSVFTEKRKLDADLEVALSLVIDNGATQAVRY